MPADEVTHGSDAGASRVRTGPRHAAPKKPLFTRFHVPAGKAIALAAMPTAVLMGMGLTPTLALADGNDPAANSKSLTAEEYQACVEALAGEKDDASATPTPSASASESEAAEDADTPSDEPSPSATTRKGTGTGTGSSSSSDSGSDDGDDGDDEDDDQAAVPAPEPSASKSASTASPSASPSPSEKDGGLLEDIGDALEGILTGGHKNAEESPAPTDGASEPASGATTDPATEAAEAAKDALKDATDATDDPGKASGTTGDDKTAADDTTDQAGQTDQADQATPSPDATATASASPSPTPSGSAGPSVDPEDCPAATDAEGGVDNTLALPDLPWRLEASSLLLKGASYKGVVEVRTASGATKKVLKYVVSAGTDIGDLHQIVQDERQNKTYHVQAAKGSTSTIKDGDTVMYTESISGNLLGLIPITFDPEHPPPLDIPVIYFTKVTVVQAGQFGGTLHIPGLHQYVTG
ncbi:hypothetical protein [Streptomyces fumanus]|uniref:Membrane-bound hydrophilic protein n=1 Tax=Streptomyces fumanus TaxID=67302 RepID=A0A919AQD4_9ACTN|nr:hypothetical protein [Streptomyces fumanus]GHF20039.1 hypothetical protein GCM10018772_51820 [Streptomyces fumanus]